MPHDPKPLLDSVAEAVSDGQAVDWSTVDSRTGDQKTRDLLRQLRLIADIAEVHRPGVSGEDEPHESEASTTSPAGGMPRTDLRFAKAVMSRRRWAHLELREMLGHGAYGIVFRAWDSQLDREVALKLIPDRADRRYAESLIHEARLMARLDHPSVVTIYGAARADGFVGLWMALVEGQTLEADLRQRGRLSGREAALVGLDVCEALAAVHGADLLHRDLKAQNVMRDRRDGRIVLMDFGAGRERPLPGDVQVSELAGTPLYMAPELFRGASATVRSDIYSMGVLLFRLVTGKTPISARSIDEVRRAHETGAVRHLRDERPDLSAGFVQTVERALSPDPETRFGSAGELELALAGLVSGRAERVRSRTARTRWYDVPRWVSLLAAILLVALAASVAWLLVQGHERRGAASPITFVVYPPPGGELGSLALSPDGTQLAMESQGRLWIRPVSAVQATEVSASRGGVSPFWSPDGQSLAFFRSGRLWTVPARGGAPTVIAEAPRVVGASWGPNDAILFAGQHGEAIYRVSARGGRPAPVRTEATSGLSELRWPVVLPSGRGFIYSARKGRDAPRAIYFAPFDGAPDRLVVETEVNAQATDDTLFYVRQGVLYAQPFDTRSGRLAGRPRRLGDRLDPSPYDRFEVQLSASATGVVAFRGGRQVDRELRLVDRSGRTVQVLGEAGEFRDIALSHDGARLAYEERDAALGTTDLWVLDLDRGSRTRVTSDPGDETCPVWSADDRTLLFLAYRGGRPRLMRISADGTGSARELFSFDADVQPFHVSPDGRWLALQQFGRDSMWDLYLLDLASIESARPEEADDATTLAIDRGAPEPRDGQPILFHRTSYADDEPRFSPDGRFLAYSSRGSGDRHVFFEPVVRAPVEHGTTARWRVSPEYGRQPQWRADGGELYYHGADRMLMAVPIDDSSSSPRLGAPTPLFELRFRGWNLRYHYAALPDGRHFVVNAPLDDIPPRPVTIVMNWPQG